MGAGLFIGRGGGRRQCNLNQTIRGAVQQVEKLEEREREIPFRV
jgi:cell division protein FtsB